MEYTQKKGRRPAKRNGYSITKQMNIHDSKQRKHKYAQDGVCALPAIKTKLYPTVSVYHNEE